MRGKDQVLLALLSGMLAACTEVATLPDNAGFGATPTLPPADARLIPTVRIAPAVGWPDGATPTPAAGMQVAAFARDLDHPRWLHVLPNGDVLVAESNAPPRPDDSPGIIGWFMRRVMQRAGAGVASANRITLLRDVDGDGVAELRHVLLQDLNSPFGMALVDGTLYVANSDAVLGFAYTAGTTRIDTPGKLLLALPAGDINHHWTKNLIVDADGKTLYVSVGSNSNVGERGMTNEFERAAIWAVDIATGKHRVFASGLRNPNGMAWAEAGSVLWTVVNERDGIGNDLVPDYLTSVHAEDFFGWPYSYYGKNVDVRVQPQDPDRVASARIPDYAVGAHTAPLGLADARGNTPPVRFAEGMFIGQHGSWNRRPPSGYKVIFVPFADGAPASDTPFDVLTGFLDEAGNAHGRPVGVALDGTGALLVADDVGIAVWRVSARHEP